MEKLTGMYKIGGNEYSVTSKSGLMAKHDLYGQVTYFDSAVEVDASLEGNRRDNVVAHELLHAIFYEAGYDEQDEEMIRRVGNVFYQFLTDNFAWTDTPEDEQ